MNHYIPPVKIDLKGQVALVTGGSRGIGAATAIMLAESGATVAINFAKNRSAARSVIEKIRKKRGNAFLVPGDVSDFLEGESILHQVIERMGRLDILINNAGIWEANPIDHPRVEERWDRTLKTNLKSVFNMCAHAVPYLKKSKGRIVNVSSGVGLRGAANYSHYATSKGGILSFTKSLATELAPYQVLANCVAPGWIWTDMKIPALKKKTVRKEILKQIPLGKIGQPEEVASAILFLVSPMASYITGEVININGGSFLSS